MNVFEFHTRPVRAFRGKYHHRPSISLPLINLHFLSDNLLLIPPKVATHPELMTAFDPEIKLATRTPIVPGVHSDSETAAYCASLFFVVLWWDIDLDAAEMSYLVEPDVQL